MGIPTAPLDCVTLKSQSQSHFADFEALYLQNGAELGPMSPLNINRKPYMVSSMVLWYH